MTYTVFSTSDSPYMQWQSELLEYSWKEVNQPGELIRLVAGDGLTMPNHRYARTLVIPSAQVDPLTGDDYAPYNKTASLLHWLRTERPDGTVLLLDPDCVFIAPICREVCEGHPVAQQWVNLSIKDGAEGFGLGRRFDFLRRHGVRPGIRPEPAMIPTLIHSKDLQRIAARWHEVTALVRQNVTDERGQPMWESDMFAYAIVAAEAGLVHELTSLGICTNWPPADAVDAPIIHYCQAIESERGAFIWSKRRYRPWRRVVEPHRARHQYGRDLLTLVNRYVNALAGDDFDRVRPAARVGVREIRAGIGLVLCAPGSNREFSLNHAAARIWALCDGTLQVRAIREQLQREFESDHLNLREALIEALATLHDDGVLIFERG